EKGTRRSRFQVSGENCRERALPKGSNSQGANGRQGRRHRFFAATACLRSGTPSAGVRSKQGKTARWVREKFVEQALRLTLAIQKAGDALGLQCRFCRFGL